MKLCWDNIENVRLTKEGNFRDLKKKYTLYLKVCEECSLEFLAWNLSNLYCSRQCKVDHQIGVKLSEETKKRMGESRRGKTHTEETKKKLSKMKMGKNNSMYSKKGEKSPFWKGGYKQKGIPTYDTYAHQLEWYEKVRRNKEDPNILEVKCFKCDKWYTPSLNNTSNRIQYLKGNYPSEHRFYCSEECKKSCSVFSRTLNQIERQDAIRAGEFPWLKYRRDVQPELRQMVLERDGHKCIKCGSKENLQCHHILPVSIEPLFSADVDNCIILCYTCHSQIHQEVDGCGYNQLKNVELC